MLCKGIDDTLEVEEGDDPVWNETLQYKQFSKGQHVMHCTACKANWHSRTEDEAKEQHKHGSKERE